MDPGRGRPQKVDNRPLKSNAQRKREWRERQKAKLSETQVCLHQCMYMYVSIYVHIYKNIFLF